MKTRAIVLLAGLLASCTQQQQPAQLRALEASGNVSFVCLNGEYEPGAMHECSDPESGRRLHALVTQTTRGEVALIDTVRGIIDIDETIPGYGFLPIGAQPVDIVSTPGSLATFVGVAEVGKEGIFALPTSCIDPPAEDDAPRDLTTWPACRLPTAPGDMAILIDRPAADGTGSCDAVPGVPGSDAGSSNVACPADLSREQEPPGRRKLMVALPEWGELGVIDAQWLLDQPPGSFEPCLFEERHALAVELPDGPVSQRPPPDLGGSSLPGLEHGPLQSSYEPRPAGFALSDDGTRLYVADLDAPVVHVVDTSRPCGLTELPPLLPMSFVDPGRVVWTNKIAVSPLTSDERRYLYAIDEADGGSVMIFDVSADSTDRTPLLRPRSALYPLEAPDRIAFTAPAKDVAFVFREWALANPPLGSAIDAVACDPDPRTPESDPGAARRPSNNLSSGARPEELRGIFAFLALSSGQVAVIDVDDRDAACRRPIHTNPTAVEDFRGCANDPEEIPFYTVDAQDPESTPTVTDELSCQVVQPHRSRSVSPVVNDIDFGVRAPALSGFPALTNAVGRRLPTDQTEEGRLHPKMLAVDFSERDPASVYVNSTLYTRGTDADSLVIDPALAEQSSVVLSLAEPRAYPVNEQFNATFEGQVMVERPVATLKKIENTGTLELVDSGIVFCDRGVESVEYMKRRADELGIVNITDNPATNDNDPATTDDDESRDYVGQFATRHADFAVITSDIPPEGNTWWTSDTGSACGTADPEQPGASYAHCLAQFGSHDAPRDLRELRVQRAERSRLVVQPRNVGANHQLIAQDLITCCFPEPISYEVRASQQWIVRGSISGFRHQIITHFADDPTTEDVDETFMCGFDANPLKAGFVSRVFEVSCNDSQTGGCPVGEDGLPIIGVADGDEVAWETAVDPRPPEVRGDFACVVNDPSTELKVAGGSKCVFSNLTTSFVIYRGLEPTQRNTTFTWEVIGGFVPFSFNLAQEGINTVPESIVFSPEGDLVAITDGLTRGFTLIYLQPVVGDTRTFF